MSQELKLQPEERLNKDNFEEWEFLINNILKSKKILSYVKTNKIEELKKKLETEKGNTIQNKQAIKEMEEEIDEAEAMDALACTIISTNVSKEVLDYIKRLSSAYDIMKKLKSMYGKKKSADIQYWMKKMYSLKATDLSECKDVINQIKEIFDIMSRSNANLGDWEKIRVLYLSFPKTLRNYIHPDGTETVEDFLNQAINKINFLIYLNSSIDYNRSINANDDLMDIDFINRSEKDISYISKNKNKNYKPKFCHMCEVNGHSTKECKYNQLTNINKENKNKITENNNNNNKRKFDKNNKKKNSKYRYKSISNMEYNDQYSDTELSFDELKTIYDHEANSIEIIEDNTHTDNNEYQDQLILNINKNEYDNKTIWTFDTGASEHITNNKEILTNFREEKITLKCANNSLCEFSGIGTYKGCINGYNIILENVLYSKQVSKILLSGIKLSQNGIICNMKPKKENVYLNLKIKNEKNKTVNIGTFMADKNNIILIPIYNKIKTDTYIDTISYENKFKLNEHSRLLWHKRLGHFYHDNLNRYLKLHNIKEVECNDCKIAKLNRKPHNSETPKATEILEVIHSDVIGPIQKSFTGKTYVLTFIDEFTRKSWIFLLEGKSEIPRTIINFFTYLTNQFKYKIKTFHSDQGTEYNNKKILNYCKESGIIKTFSPPYNPQNNGIAERFNYM